MPKAFSKKEKEIIMQILMKKGKDIFGLYGLKKTTVDDLSKAAGIAKGSFYLFFNSKEECFFAILEAEEAALKDRMQREIIETDIAPREKLRAMLKQGLAALDSNPFLKTVMEPGEMQNLMRRLPPEVVQAHIRKDAHFAEPLLKQWKKTGILEPIDINVLIGTFRALVMLGLHKDIIGKEIFPAVMDVFIDSLCDSLIRE